MKKFRFIICLNKNKEKFPQKSFKSFLLDKSGVRPEDLARAMYEPTKNSLDWKIHLFSQWKKRIGE